MHARATTTLRILIFLMQKKSKEGCQSPQREAETLHPIARGMSASEPSSGDLEQGKAKVVPSSGANTLRSKLRMLHSVPDAAQARVPKHDSRQGIDGGTNWDDSVP